MKSISRLWLLHHTEFEARNTERGCGCKALVATINKKQRNKTTRIIGDEGFIKR
jgi:hypothetical protein